MKNTSKTLLFFGNERLSTGFKPDGAPTLRALIQAGYEIKAVIAHHTQPNSRNKRDLEIEVVARTHNIPVLLPEKPSDIREELAGYRADAAVLVAYGKIIPQSIIDLFPRGIINLHPSLLPLYRGPTPIEQVILDGVDRTGISIMSLTANMDEGPVFAQTEIALDGTETKFDLTTRLLDIGSQLLVETLPQILDGSMRATEQTAANATYTKLLDKADASLDITKSADRLTKEVRAYEGWPKSKLSLFGYSIIVIKARAAPQEDTAKLIVKCGNNTFLEIQELIAPSGKKISGTSFLRGYAS